VSCFLFLGTKIYNADGKLVPGTSHVLLVDATVQFLSKEHLPFAITAFLILVFTLLPPMQICKRNQAEDELSDADQLPHRLVNPSQYNKTLLSVSEQADDNSETLAIRGRFPPVYTYGSIS